MHKKTWIPFFSPFIVALFIGVAFAATKWINKDGGVIKIRSGVELVIPPRALDENTEIKIHAHMSSRQIIDEKGMGRKLLVFTFKPPGTKFNSPVELHIDKSFFDEGNPDDIVICETSGEEGKEPYVRDNGSELIIEINHFSYYYHRRR
jgi:hypothetical protein